MKEENLDMGIPPIILFLPLATAWLRSYVAETLASHTGM
jgi:hypothetical protein